MPRTWLEGGVGDARPREASGRAGVRGGASGDGRGHFTVSLLPPFLPLNCFCPTWSRQLIPTWNSGAQDRVEPGTGLSRARGGALPLSAGPGRAWPGPGEQRGEALASAASRRPRGSVGELGLRLQVRGLVGRLCCGAGAAGHRRAPHLCTQARGARARPVWAAPAEGGDGPACPSSSHNVGPRAPLPDLPLLGSRQE